MIYQINTFDKYFGTTDFSFLPFIYIDMAMKYCKHEVLSGPTGNPSGGIWTHNFLLTTYVMGSISKKFFSTDTLKAPSI